MAKKVDSLLGCIRQYLCQHAKGGNPSPLLSLGEISGILCPILASLVQEMYGHIGSCSADRLRAGDVQPGEGKAWGSHECLQIHVGSLPNGAQ